MRFGTAFGMRFGTEFGMRFGKIRRAIRFTAGLCQVGTPSGRSGS
jgi:hypothetical protein